MGIDRLKKVNKLDNFLYVLSLHKWHYLTYISWDKGAYAFPKSIYLNIIVNLLVRLEFEVAFYDATVQNVIRKKETHLFSVN